MLNSAHRQKPTMSLQEMIRLYLALPGYSNQFFFFLLIFLSLVLGIPGAIGTFASLFFINRFSLIVFLISLWLLLVALNILTLLLLSKRAMKQQPLPKINDYTSEQIMNTVMRIIGLVICPLLLLLVALLQVRKGLW